MDARSLRIGNWVKFTGNWCCRSSTCYQDNNNDVGEFQWNESDWYAVGECTLDLNEVEPITLTEEWLVRFGFDKKDSTWRLNEICISSWFSFRFSEDPLKVQEIDYVHQLQNLYHALTGKELELNTEK